MQNEIIKTALLHPETLKDVIVSEYVEERVNEKLKRIQRGYLKTGKMPKREILEEIFRIDLQDENEADSEVVYQIIHDLNVERYIGKVYDELHYNPRELTIEKIHDLEKQYLKDYGSKEENSFQISSLEDIKKLRERINQKEENFLQTGYPSINALTESDNQENPGGWHPGAIYTVMGLSGFGKSIFLANFARDMWELDNNVLYISTEMDQDETFDRIIKSKFKAKNMDEAVLLAQSQTIPSSNIKVIKVHPNDTTCDDIQKLIDALDWTPDILLVDYADELKSHESTINEYEAQGVVYAGLKKLAEVNNLPVLTATQTNRAAEDSENGGTKKYVGYSAIADSSKKIRLVDMLFAITQSKTEKAEGLIHLSAVKNRFGESQKKITFSINYQTMRIEEIAQKETVVDVKTEPPTETEKRELTPAEKILMGGNHG